MTGGVVGIDALTFEQLIAEICQADNVLSAQATRAVNVALTLRNWVIGFYIAEFELQGADRAAYGDNLLTELSRELRAKQVSTTGRRQLYGYLAFYRAYPQIVQTLPALSVHLSALHALEKKVRTLSAQSASDSISRLSVDPARLVSCLSYSHFEQIIEQADSLKRSFYEIEAIRGNWSVRELKRQIATQYFERSGLSTDKDALSKLVHASADTYLAHYKQHQMTAGDQSPIGVLLCTHKNHELVEFALADMSNKLFVKGRENWVF
jgi:hypothetical protein